MERISHDVPIKPGRCPWCDLVVVVGKSGKYLPHVRLADGGGELVQCRGGGETEQV